MSIDDTLKNEAILISQYSVIRNMAKIVRKLHLNIKVI